MPIKVIIADDHEISRIGIRRLLSIAPDIDIIGEAVDGAHALEISRLKKPDVVLLDVLMPNVSGIEAAQRIKAEMKEISVIMLSAAEDEKSIERAMYAGADGYLSKEVTSEELVAAIRTVILGERVFSRSILNLLEGKVQDQKTNEPPVTLTKREEEIVTLVAKGLTSQDIAKKLFISPRTVETHRARIMDKLGVNNAAGLVRFALLHATYFNVGNNGE
ncbi:MAG: response regulator transcription factor [Ignavibacteria bacterium]|nr:response regulator transcription factor [Ignavibacteria bacterium]MBP6509718.1 response regulator transcription factor [Candidatus Kapabacteria bacterium]MBK6420479.1 response regulator transcription factor [Ignavibacteria bacterium]MBK6761565.1 response regulator transcription factor [Ignavibacteria bacterium]MBK7033590.1 response regulator transcription factor [Ignavibacteria bacterium]